MDTHAATPTPAGGTEGASASLLRPTWLTFDRLTVILFFVLIATIACLMPAQTDTWWQLRGGQQFWQTGSVPLVETYSHTATGRFWMNHEWLSLALFYAAYAAGGLPLLTLLAVALVTTSVALSWSLMRGPLLVRLGLIGAALGTMSIAWTPRPHVFTLCLVSLTAWLVVRGHARWLPLVFLGWANLHGGFTLGVGLLGAYWLCGLGGGSRVIVERSVLAAICLLMTIVTPLGVGFWEELPASLARLQAYDVMEWQGPTFTDGAVFPFWLALGALGFVAATRWRAMLEDPEDRFLFVASLAFVPLALTSLRNIPPFLVLCLPTLTRAVLLGARDVVPSVSPAQGQRHLAVLASGVAVAMLVVGLAWSQPLPRLQWEPVSESVLRAVDECDGPLYNSYDDGGYLVWFLPHRPVFLDSRQDPFPVELIQQDLRIQFEGDYRDAFDTYAISCAFIRSGTLIDRTLQGDGWDVRHRDAVWTVLAAGPAATRAALEPTTGP